ncbi:MAG: fructose-bisphosphatase class II family protein [Chloroflexus sp.]|uniref:fructose-bisphosphatase class II family protein n=1 Tax=Chloroflexus sp. TaxID=1904827 RepID=UPI00404A8AB7
MDVPLSQKLGPNTGLDLVRATEAAAIAAARLMGRGEIAAADQAATTAMAAALANLELDGRLVMVEEVRVREMTTTALSEGMRIGTGNGPPADLIVDPIDGRRQLAQGKAGAVSFAAVTNRGALWAPHPAAYMEKIIVGPQAAPYLAPECLDAPAGWTLALVARATRRSVRDLVVFVLDRPRHSHLIEEIRAAGARVMLADDGDIYGALLAAIAGTNVDILMGIGGAPEGVLAACAVKSLGGAMLARLAPQNEAEHEAITRAGLDTKRILTCDDIVSSNQIFFVATGITDSVLLRGVRLAGDRAETNSLILRCETRTRRIIFAEHLLTG